MRSLRYLLLALAVACGTTVTETTVAPPSTMTRTTTPSTAEAVLAVVVEGCEAPQVGFAPLCDAYQLVQEWHMDRPIEPAVLAEAARQGLEDFSTEEVEPLPRTLFCAIPDPAFEPLCNLLADRMVTEGLPVTPAVEAALGSLAEVGLDPFSYYLGPEMVGAFRLNGVVDGVGILLDAVDAAGSHCARIAPSCPLQVVAVLDQSPGDRAGIVTGDQIVAIDGTPVDGMGFVHTAALIGGDLTGSVELALTRGDQPIVVSVERGPLPIPTVEIDVPSPGVGYIRIPDFEADIPRLVDEAMEELMATEPARLVVDLRDNPGGLIEALLPVAGEFMDGVVMEASAQGESVAYQAEGGPPQEVQLAVLVNAGTASAAEVLAAALRDRRGAQVIGRPTFGKDVLQIPFALDNGGELHVAVARWRSPSGTTVAGTGLVPDRSVDLSSSLSTEDLANLAFE